MKLYVTKKVSKKSNKEYIALILEKDGETYFLSFDLMTIMNVANMTPNDIRRLKIDEKIVIE